MKVSDHLPPPTISQPLILPVSLSSLIISLHLLVLRNILYGVRLILNYSPPLKTLTSTLSLFVLLPSQYLVSTNSPGSFLKMPHGLPSRYQNTLFVSKFVPFLSILLYHYITFPSPSYLLLVHPS